MDNSNQNNSMNLQDHAWRYFAFHANQRILLFRLYIAILVFYSSAIGFLFVRFYLEGLLPEIAVIFSSTAFAILTIIFQLLDRRNCQLIGYAEDALKELEFFYIPAKETTLKIFTIEEQAVKKRQSIGQNSFITVKPFIILIDGIKNKFIFPNLAVSIIGDT